MPVIHAGRIYVAWDRLRALNWETGEAVWEGPVVGDAGSCVVTDEKLIVGAHRGELFLADISAQEKAEYRELARLSRLAKTDVGPHVAFTLRWGDHRRRRGVQRLTERPTLPESCFGVPDRRAQEAA